MVKMGKQDVYQRGREPGESWQVPGGHPGGGGTPAGLEGWERRMKALQMLTGFCKCIMFSITVLDVNHLGMRGTLSPFYG